MTRKSYHDLARIVGEASEPAPTLVWKTASDWSNYESNNGIMTTNDFISVKSEVDDFEDLSTTSTIPDPWNKNGSGYLDDSRALGNVSFRSTGIDGNDETITTNAIDPHENMVYTMRYNETSSQGGAAWGLQASDGGVIWEGVTGNPQRGFTDGDGTIEYDDLTYNKWYGWKVDGFDFDNWTHDVHILDSNGAVEESWLSRSMATQKKPQKIWYGSNKLGSYSYTVEQASAIWWDDIFGTYSQPSNLITGTKSFSSPQKVNLTELVYSINGGQIDIDVIGSPNTASEEVVTKQLEGLSNYSLNWSNSHTDFRFKIYFSPSSGIRFSNTPTIGKLVLIAK